MSKLQNARVRLLQSSSHKCHMSHSTATNKKFIIHDNYLKQAWLVVFTAMKCIERLVESACGCVCCLVSSQHTTPSKKRGVAYNKVLSRGFFNHHFYWEWDITLYRMIATMLHLLWVSLKISIAQARMQTKQTYSKYQQLSFIKMCGNLLQIVRDGMEMRRQQ
jgi:hypothetical protein